eukprot:431161_1
MAVGSYNQSVFLLGGYPVSTLLYTYDIRQNSFTTTNISQLDAGYSRSQYYTVMDNILYFAAYEYISIYNMNTNTYVQQWQHGPTQNVANQCLTSTKDLLFVIGGKFNGTYVLDVTVIFNFSSHSWFNSASINTARTQHACAASDIKLYTMGGLDSVGGYLSSIERVNIIDVVYNISWTIIGDLNSAVDGLRAVTFEDKIVIIGGEGSANSDYELLVHIIDTNNDEISTLPDPLPYGLLNHSPIVVGNVLYIFAGYTWGVGGRNTWIYYELPTYDPTETPTREPSDSPSLLPSMPPTIQTYDPTETPTREPSDSPSLLPSMPPTIQTYDPTRTPTRGPSETPSLFPSKSPTCSDGYKQNNNAGTCTKCKEYEAGTGGECERCGAGKSPNVKQTDCVLCNEQLIGNDGHCDVE